MTGAADGRTFIYRIDVQDRIIFLNREWIDFARENRALELTPEYLLGQPLENFIAGWETKHLYEIIYEKVRQTGREVNIPFRCDSPELKRFFHMRLHQLDRGELEFVVHVLRTEPRLPTSLLDNTIEHRTQIVVICSWCKRVQADDSHWTEVDDATPKMDLFGPSPPTLTHEICPDCMAIIQRQLHITGQPRSES